MSAVVLEGRGLHGGRTATVTLRRVEARAPVTLRRGDAVARVDELLAVAVVRATTVATADERLRVATAEHLFAALAGLGIYGGLAIEIDGDELPLLDGAAAAWVRALEGLHLAPGPPALVVARDGEISVRASTYTFRAAGRGAAVRFETDNARLVPDASWDGTTEDFARVAPARTFAFARELPHFEAQGLASHVAPESVVVLAEDAVLFAGAPFSADEPARHKLLDLIGDLYLYGGPPRGAVHARRPGHAATHEAVRRALSEGILTRRAAPG